MSQTRKPVYSLAAILSVTGVTKVAFAALLGVILNFPVVSYNGTGQVTYSATTNLFNISASPITVRLSGSSPPRLINPTGFPPTESLTINVQVDNTGALISGAPGDDLAIIGEVDIDGDTVIDYAGTLLTGEVLQFGFLDTGTPTDRYDFRFSLTGGLLAGYFAGQDIGVLVTSEGSDFGGSFTVDITGGAKGNVGGIPRLNQPPLCNANGPYEAECAGDVTIIHLDGTQSTDPDMDQLTYTWTTDCPGAAIDDPHAADPTITLSTGGQCNLTCTVTLVVSDGTHTSAPCYAQITVTDSNAPSVACGEPEVTIACGQPTDTDPPTVNDDCDPDPIVTHEDTITPGACAQSYTITRRWSAADHCGNSASCEQTIHVVDNVAPTISCPQNISVSCVQGINPQSTGQATADDNCDPQPQVTFSDSTAPGACPAVAVITRTWKARDACGNEATCEQTITLTDPSGPTITCPQDVTINCGESKAPSHTGFATAMDSCDPNPAVTYEDTYSGTCPRIVNRKWTATDACGNSVSCVQKITIVDLVPPEITCPQNLTLSCGADTSTTSTGTAQAADNCDSAPVVTYTDTVSGSGCPRTITRVWKATDKCGNFVTCTQTITITGSAPCPRTPGYWKNHREAWPVSSLTVGCVTYNEAQLMNLLSNKLPNGVNAGSDMSAALAKFVIATTFNLMTGSPPDNIQSWLDDAHDFLCDYPPGSNPKGGAKQNATRLKDKLDVYCNSTPNGCFGG